MKKMIFRIILILLVLIMGIQPQLKLNASPASQEEKNMTVVKRIIEAVKTKEMAVFDQLMPPEMADSSKRVVNYWWEQYSQVTAPIDDIFASGDKVAVRWTLFGKKDRNLEEDWEVRFVSIFQVTEGKVVEMWLGNNMLQEFRKHGFILKPPEPKTLELKLKATMGDIKTIGVVVGHYKTDKDYVPKVDSIEAFAKMTQPFYIKTCPLRDAWGNRLLYKYDKNNPKHYWVASPGSDGKFNGFDQEGTWDSTTDNGQDIVLFNGKFVYYPEIKKK
jgi:hypothetical protein